MRMKLAILTAGSSTHTKGIMNFVCEEARQMKKKESKDFSCDVYMIREKPTRLLNFFLRIKGKGVAKATDEGQPTFSVDGVLFHNIWVKEGLLSFLVRTRLLHLPFNKKNIEIVTDTLKSYDFILTHKSPCQFIGLELFKKYNIPFAAFWHGTELASTTFSNKYSYRLTKNILENAQSNFFVSKALQKIATTITEVHNGQVIYTGPSDMFYEYSLEKKKELRTGFGVANKDVVIAYVGNLIPVKNVLQLPPLFKCIQEKCPERSFKFWIIGNGVLEKELMGQLELSGVDFTMHGKVKPNKMPDYMNCIDALLLISKKEGLGLVCLEAMKCGANVFGSLAGGIPEVVGDEHCAVLDDCFVENLSNIIVMSIRNNEKRSYPGDIFSWETAISQVLKSISE